MKKNSKLITIITSIFIAFVLLISAVKFTLNFRPLFYFDIDYLKIEQTAEMEKSDIIKNYDVLIDYLKTSHHEKLKFPSLAMSEPGRIHFEEVKNIFVKLDYFMYFSLFISIIGIYYLYKKKDYLFFRYSAFFLLGIPILLFIPFLIDFNRVFVIFHEIAFDNNYWLFDPELDPVILMLPETFFMHTAILILVIITIESIILNILYRYHVKKFVSKHK